MVIELSGIKKRMKNSTTRTSRVHVLMPIVPHVKNNAMAYISSTLKVIKIKSIPFVGVSRFEVTSEILIRIYLRSLWHVLFVKLSLEIGPQTPIVARPDSFHDFP